MEIIAGKTVLTTLEEIVDPKRAAVLVVDVQNDFCSEEGVWAQRGGDLSMMETVIPAVSRLIGGARTHGTPVIYIQMINLPDLRSISPSYLRFMTTKCNLAPEEVGCAPGTWGAEILPQVAPQPGELVITKWRSSAFVGTNLDLVLRGNGIESVIVCGVATQACVESTIRDAFNTDYYVVEVEDAVGGYDRALHNASLSVMRGRVDVVPVDRVLDAWEARSAGLVAMERMASVIAND